jgi:phage terminase large subunit-like protein
MPPSWREKMSSKRSSTDKSPARRFANFCELIELDLERFQREIVDEAFSDRRETLILIPRGNGKTTLLAAFALYHLFFTPNPQVAIGAASREQAGVLFEIARGMIQHPKLRSRCETTRREIRTKSGWIRVISSDGPKQHGMVLSLAIVDELHRHPDLDKPFELVARYGDTAVGIGKPGTSGTPRPPSWSAAPAPGTI